MQEAARELINKMLVVEGHPIRYIGTTTGGIDQWELPYGWKFCFVGEMHFARGVQALHHRRWITTRIFT